MSIADVRRWRKMAGISQKKAAELVSYTENHYRCIERGDQPMPAGFDQRFARKLQRHCEHLLKVIEYEANA